MPAFYFDIGGVVIASAPVAPGGFARVPATLDLVERLRARGETVGLATAFPRAWVEALIARTPALSGVALCCAPDVGAAKTEPAFFTAAQALVGAGDVVFVDDQHENVQAARAFGWTAILADDGWQRRFADRYLRAR